MTSKFTQAVMEDAGKFDFVAAHFQCEQDRYSLENPGGFVNLGSAQNFLQPKDRINRIRSIPVGDDDPHYQAFHGTESCRRRVAGYLQSIAKEPIGAGNTVDPDDIVIGNGIISLLESLAFALLDEGDSCLVPTPVFPGLVAALSLRVKSKIAWMHTDSEAGFRLTPNALEMELRRQRAAGVRIKAVLICSPGNPIGQVFTRSEIYRFIEIAKEFNCSLIVDEVYANSCFDGVSFCSAVAAKASHVYVLGGLSKDFGLAGYATGWLHSTNTSVIRAMKKQAHFYRLPSPVQRVIEAVLAPDWYADHLARHRRLLTDQFAIACDEFSSAGVKVTQSDSGLCLWLDLRDQLSSPNLAGEMAVYQFMLRQQRVHISPGSGFYSRHYGFFRICFSHDELTFSEGIRRILGGLQVNQRRLVESTWV